MSSAHGRPGVPDLAAYHVILVSISGGKDSQAALDLTWHAARAAARLVTVFADLGPGDEGPRAPETAAGHAAHYGIRHETAFREIITPDSQRVQQTLSEHIEARGMWPGPATLHCTSGGISSA